ncbi:hypothetical protein NXX56_13485 [Bacteroides thetaiotaomicron]|nr:hypothetical protein [Bacteroides thetaiotaomicron]
MKDKNIVIKLGELYDGGNYYYIIYIENDKFPQKETCENRKGKERGTKKNERS